MLNPSFRELAAKADSRYTVVMLIAKRARQIIEGRTPLVETDANKAVSVALEEVFADEVTYRRTE